MSQLVFSLIAATSSIESSVAAWTQFKIVGTLVACELCDCPLRYCL